VGSHISVAQNVRNSSTSTSGIQRGEQLAVRNLQGGDQRVDVGAIVGRRVRLQVERRGPTVAEVAERALVEVALGSS